MIRTLQESICLQNIFISLYNSMILYPNLSFEKFMYNYVSSNEEHKKSLANAVLDTCISNIIKECIVLQNQIWKNNHNAYNDSLIRNEVLYNIIKDKIKIKGTVPFNKKESFKRIRQAIAHNSKEIENCQYDINGYYNLNLGKSHNDTNGEEIKISLSLLEMVQLIMLLASNRRKDTISTISFDKVEINSIDDAKKSIYLSSNSESHIDNNQATRVYNALHYCLNKTNLDDAVNEIGLIIPGKSNEQQVLDEKLITLSFLTALYNGGSWNSMKKAYPIMNQPLYVVSVYFSLITNILFTIVTSRNNNEISELFADTGLSLSAQDIRHMRNALCHGRYFHDYNNKFYFYDGKKELTFEMNLSIQDINKILDKIAKGQYPVYVLDKED